MIRLDGCRCILTATTEMDFAYTQPKASHAFCPHFVKWEPGTSLRKLINRPLDEWSYTKEVIHFFVLTSKLRLKHKYEKRELTFHAKHPSEI
jgi:hypothetical protein